MNQQDVTHGVPDYYDIDFSENPLNALNVLKRQHRHIEKLFHEILTEGADSAADALVEEVCDELILHSEIEEFIFYPALRELNTHAYFEAEDAHSKVKDLIKLVRESNSGSGLFLEQVELLKSVVEEHVQEEEKVIFPIMEENLGDEALEYMGKTMLEIVNRRII